MPFLQSMRGITGIFLTLRYWEFWIPLILILTAFVFEFGYMFNDYLFNTHDPTPIAKELARKVLAVDSKILSDTQNLVAHKTIISLGFWFRAYLLLSDFMIVLFALTVIHRSLIFLLGEGSSGVVIIILMFFFLLFAGMMELIYVKYVDDIWVIPFSGIVNSVWLLIIYLVK